MFALRILSRAGHLSIGVKDDDYITNVVHNAEHTEGLAFQTMNQSVGHTLLCDSGHVRVRMGLHGKTARDSVASAQTALHRTAVYRC